MITNLSDFIMRALELELELLDAAGGLLRVGGRGARLGARHARGVRPRGRHRAAPDLRPLHVLLLRLPRHPDLTHLQQLQTSRTVVRAEAMPSCGTLYSGHLLWHTLYI